MSKKYAQARYWALTIPKDKWTKWTELPEDVACIKGQEEIGSTTGYHHWQLFVAFKNKVRKRVVINLFGKDAHCEATRSEAYEKYCGKKDNTTVEGTFFELGKKALKRNSKADWDEVWEAAKKGKIEDIDVSLRIRHYNTLKRIEKDYDKPTICEKEVFVFWGAAGTGKSHRAWEEAGLEAYIKDPCTKFWDGYQGEENVIIEEFKGDINLSHMLRWMDKWPVRFEVKFGTACSRVKRIWITSNVDPRNWYPQANSDQMAALIRRIKITHFNKPL